MTEFTCGKVDLLEYMGGDKAIMDSARFTYESVSDNFGPKDHALMKLLLEKNHTSPLEHCVMRFDITCPIFVARQWLRHRHGSFSERSGRHVTFKPDAFYIPDAVKGTRHEELIKCLNSATFAGYKQMVDQGVAKQDARAILPLGTYTSFIWTVNMRSMLNFLSQRLDKHAQMEIRKLAYGTLIEMQTRNVAPVLIKTWLDSNPSLMQTCSELKTKEINP